ncbi:MAG TPA: hypothetical protein VGG75_42625 [Trebonia sp.]|jgi:hypothetical protein
MDDSQGTLAKYPTTAAFAGLVLLALAFLVITRLFFGSIRIEAGTR